MLGAVCGDVIGSKYERDNIKTKNFPLFSSSNNFTDDSVMTCAVANASYEYLQHKDYNKFRDDCVYYMQNLGLSHINAGYGGTFIHWLMMNNPQPYYSFGNGSAMRVSPVAFVSQSLEEVLKLAEISASVSHNHPEGIKGAQVVAAAIWFLKNGKTKEYVKKYVNENFYNLNFKIDDIRDSYQFDVTCQGSVPEAIVCFLEANSFEDAIRNAVSLGGDSDTIAAIAGSLAEAYYGIPNEIVEQTLSFLDDDLKKSLGNFYNLEKRYR